MDWFTSTNELHERVYAPYGRGARSRRPWEAAAVLIRLRIEGMSSVDLSREFRLVYGESPYGYLRTRRIERAMALLRRGDLTVSEVCFAVGCSLLGSFSSRFTEPVGVPPSVYRRQVAQATVGLPSWVAKQVTRPVRNQEAPAPERPLR